jgi:hypothetical protein
MDVELYLTALAVLATMGIFKFIRESIWWYRVEKKTHRVLEDIDSE